MPLMATFHFSKLSPNQLQLLFLQNPPILLLRTKKIFVGGLPPTLTEDGFRQYFEAYGHVTDVVIMYDQNTQRPRGFGIISFDTEDAVDRVLHKNYHDLNGKQVEVKRALPKDANPGGVSRTMSGGAGGGGGYQGYGASGGNTSSYDGCMDSKRYMQAQSIPPYGSSGYTPGYGYDPANNGVVYGAAYGNPNAGYASGPPRAPRSSWGTQTPSGYGTMGYGNAAPWGAPTAGGSGAPGSAATGQSPTGAAGYGGQGYGYGGHGGNDGSYGNAGYGAVGGRSGGTPNSNAAGSGGGDLQGSGGGYIGSGYGDAIGSSGYGNTSWRRRGAREFKGGVKCPLMAENELRGGGCSVWGMFSRGLAQLRFRINMRQALPHPGADDTANSWLLM
ncbi:hypothetical protein REPUB_Repub15cG0039500 [Reevesia pubescens]